MNFITLIIFFFWFFAILPKIFFWVWLWQLKEYRLDRFLAHFELQSSRKIFFNKINVLKLLLLAASLIFFFLSPKENLRFGVISAIFIFYIGLGLSFFIIFFTKRVKFPKKSMKAILILTLCIGTVSGVFYVLTVFDLSLFLSGVVAADIFLILFISFWIAFLKLPSDFFKQKIINEAKEKITKSSELLVIGITGSYGKTSVKEILAHILSKKFNILKTEANQNTEIGVAKTVLSKLKKDNQIFIVEMGAYKTGEIKKICDIVKPKIGILTAIGTQHLSLFGSRENIIKGKYELIEFLPQKGLSIFNGDNNYCLDLYNKTNMPKRVYSVSDLSQVSNSLNKNINASEIKVFKDGLEFQVLAGNEKQNFKAKLVGFQNISNILAAAITAKELGMSLEEISQAVAEIKPFSHTLEIKKGISDTIFIDDSYSANFEGVMAALDYLNLYKSMDSIKEYQPKKIMIFYPMIELGNMAKELHRKVGVRIGKVCDLCVLTSSDFSKEIIAGAALSGMNLKNILIYQKPISVIDKVKSFIKKGDVILAENRINKEIIRQLTL